MFSVSLAFVWAYIRKNRRTFFFEIFWLEKSYFQVWMEIQVKRFPAILRNATRCALNNFGPIFKLNLGGDRFLSLKSWKSTKNRWFIEPLWKFSHRNKKRFLANLSVLIPRIIITFQQISIYGLGGDIFWNFAKWPPVPTMWRLA